MLMKKIKFLSMIFAASLIAFSCDDSEAPEASLVSGSQTEFTVAPEGGSASISFSCTDNWAASTNSKWLVLDHTYGKAGSVSISATADANADLTGDRIGTVTVICGQQKLVYSISQAVSSSVSPALGENGEGEIPALGGKVSFEFSSTLEWTASADAPWLALSKTSGTTGRGIILTASASANDDVDRTAKISVVCGSQTIEFSVKQRATANELDYAAGEEKDIEIQPLGEKRTIKFTSTRPWTASVDNDFVTLSATSGDRGAGAITLTVPTNRIEDRTAVVTVVSDEKTIEFNVSQKASYVWLPDDATSEFNIDYHEQELEITFSTSKDWTIVSDKPSITLSEEAGSAAEDITVKVTVPQNDLTVPVSAKVTISAGGQTAVISITQAFKFQPYVGNWAFVGNDSNGAYNEDWTIGEYSNAPGQYYLNTYIGETVDVAWDDEQDCMVIPTGLDNICKAYNFNGIGPCGVAPMYKAGKYVWATDEEDQWPIYCVLDGDSITIAGIGINAEGTKYTYYFGSNVGLMFALYPCILDDAGKITGFEAWNGYTYKGTVTATSITRAAGSGTSSVKSMSAVVERDGKTSVVEVSPISAEKINVPKYRK